MRIDVKNCNGKKLNEEIAESRENVILDNCMGERFIAVGLGGKSVEINGIAGNALGAYLDGATISANGNVQDAVGDTMNSGSIFVFGNAGDALGYAMRGGKIYIKGNSGYRTGVHLKEYQDKKPVIIIGGKTGSFLGEYQAGGLIIVLNLNDEKKIVGNFTGTGMHGGKIFLRSAEEISNLPVQVVAKTATPEDKREIECYLKEYCEKFTLDYDKIIGDKFLVLTPNTLTPYKKLFVAN